MKKVFLGLITCACLSVLVVACGKNDSSSSNPPPPPPPPNCAAQPGTVWNGSACVYANNTQCANIPGSTWNGTSCVGGTNTSCGGGLVYTYQGCLPQGYCAVGQAQSTYGCIPAMSVNGGYPAGYPGGYPTGGAYPPGYGGYYGGGGVYGGVYGGYGYPRYY